MNLFKFVIRCNTSFTSYYLQQLEYVNGKMNERMGLSSCHCSWGIGISSWINAKIFLRWNEDIKTRGSIKHFWPREVQRVLAISWRNQEISWFDCGGCWGIAPSKENLWLAAGAYASRSVLISHSSALPPPLGPFFVVRLATGQPGSRKKLENWG